MRNEYLHAATDAHPVLGGLDLLNVEATNVVSREDTERVDRNAVIATHNKIVSAHHIPTPQIQNQN